MFHHICLARWSLYAFVSISIMPMMGDRLIWCSVGKLTCQALQCFTFVPHDEVLGTPQAPENAYTCQTAEDVGDVHWPCS